MMRATASCLAVALLCMGVLCGCPSKHDPDQARLRQELGLNVPLWVELECNKKGKPVFGDYSVLKMPDEKMVWAIAKLGDKCRIYGALQRKGSRKTDLCDIRFRSKNPVVDSGRCKCVAGRYDLEEGRPTSKKCCRKYPDSVYCKPADAPMPELKTPESDPEY